MPSKAELGEMRRDCPLYMEACDLVDEMHASKVNGAGDFGGLPDIEAIADPMERLKAYARIATNREPELHMREVRVRAEKECNKRFRAIRKQLREAL